MGGSSGFPVVTSCRGLITLLVMSLGMHVVNRRHCRCMIMTSATMTAANNHTRVSRTSGYRRHSATVRSLRPDRTPEVVERLEVAAVTEHPPDRRARGEQPGDDGRQEQQHAVAHLSQPAQGNRRGVR